MDDRSRHIQKDAELSSEELSDVLASLGLPPVHSVDLTEHASREDLRNLIDAANRLRKSPPGMRRNDEEKQRDFNRSEALCNMVILSNPPRDLLVAASNNLGYISNERARHLLRQIDSCIKSRPVISPEMQEHIKELHQECVAHIQSARSHFRVVEENTDPLNAARISGLRRGEAGFTFCNEIAINLERQLLNLSDERRQYQVIERCVHMALYSLRHAMKALRVAPKSDKAQKAGAVACRLMGEVARAVPGIHQEIPQQTAVKLREVLCKCREEVESFDSIPGVNGDLRNGAILARESINNALKKTFSRETAAAEVADRIPQLIVNAAKSSRGSNLDTFQAKIAAAIPEPLKESLLPRIDKVLEAHEFDGEDLAIVCVLGALTSEGQNADSLIRDIRRINLAVTRETLEARIRGGRYAWLGLEVDFEGSDAAAEGDLKRGVPSRLVREKIIPDEKRRLEKLGAEARNFVIPWLDPADQARIEAQVQSAEKSLEKLQAESAKYSKKKEADRTGQTALATILRGSGGYMVQIRRLESKIAHRLNTLILPEIRNRISEAQHFAMTADRLSRTADIPEAEALSHHADSLSEQCSKLLDRGNEAWLSKHQADQLGREIEECRDREYEPLKKRVDSWEPVESRARQIGHEWPEAVRHFDEVSSIRKSADALRMTARRFLLSGAAPPSGWDPQAILHDLQQKRDEILEAEEKRQRLARAAGGLSRHCARLSSHGLPSDDGIEILALLEVLAPDIQCTGDSLFSGISSFSTARQVLEEHIEHLRHAEENLSTQQDRTAALRWEMLRPIVAFLGYCIYREKTGVSGIHMLNPGFDPEPYLTKLDRLDDELFEFFTAPVTPQSVRAWREKLPGLISRYIGYPDEEARTAGEGIKDSDVAEAKDIINQAYSVDHDNNPQAAILAAGGHQGNFSTLQIWVDMPHLLERPLPMVSSLQPFFKDVCLGEKIYDASEFVSALTQHQAQHLLRSGKPLTPSFASRAGEDFDHIFYDPVLTSFVDDIIISCHSGASEELEKRGVRLLNAQAAALISPLDFGKPEEVNGWLRLMDEGRVTFCRSRLPDGNPSVFRYSRDERGDVCDVEHALVIPMPEWEESRLFYVLSFLELEEMLI